MTWRSCARPSRTFPVSEFYDLERELTQLGIGEALVTGPQPEGRAHADARGP